jgi:ribosomal protein S25
MFANEMMEKNELLQNKKIVARMVGEIFKQSGVSMHVLAKRVKIKIKINKYIYIYICTIFGHAFGFCKTCK